MPTVGFIDPCALPGNPGASIMLFDIYVDHIYINKGWPLRNFLILLAKKFHVKSLRVICCRQNQSSSNKSDIFSSAIVLDVQMPKGNKIPWKLQGRFMEHILGIAEHLSEDSIVPKCVGWEKNEKNQFKPKVVDLSSIMDPIRYPPFPLVIPPK
jgi:ubiquitin-like modifier-activating enzyme ATG7